MLFKKVPGSAWALLDVFKYGELYEMLHDIISVIELLFLFFSPNFWCLGVSLDLLASSPGSHKLQIPVGMSAVWPRLATGAAGVSADL